MPRVKIIKVYHHESNFESYHDVGPETKWDEVTTEELKMLIEWADKKNENYDDGAYYIIVSDEDITPENCIKDYLSMIKKDEIKEKEEEAKKAEAKAKREKKAREKKKAKELKELERLQKMYVKDGQ